MKTPIPSRAPSGVSLLETVIAVAVIAVAVPLALAAVGRAGVTGAAARAETRAPGVAEWCRVELEAARRGRSGVLPPIAGDVALPAGGEALALAFDREGSLLGRVSAEDYEQGVDRIQDDSVAYVASLSGRAEPGGVVVTVRVEYPAARPVGRRDAVSFHTILP